MDKNEYKSLTDPISEHDSASNRDPVFNQDPTPNQDPVFKQSSFFKRNKFRHLGLLIALLCVVIVAFIGIRLHDKSLAVTPVVTTGSSTTPTSCSVSATLVNSCRPWLGAAVEDYTQTASDPVSQFTYEEQAVGKQLDVFHDYHPVGSLPLNSSEIHFADRANTYVYINWKPASSWAEAGGSDATVNANIDKAAASIKSISPNKVFLTIWHEPENDVSPGTSSCPGLKGSAGSPAQYKAMWSNVENRFKADGVTNVVWVMNYMGYQQWDCLVPQLWPGNDLVNWVTYDPYSVNESSTWDNTVGRFYQVLQNDSNTTDNFTSKPWGLAEFNDCDPANTVHEAAFFSEAKAALDANTYPNLKMYLLFDANGTSGYGCTLNATQQASFNAFANDPRFMDAYYTTPGPTIAITSPANGATVSKIVVISDKVTAAAGIKEVSLSWDGTHAIRNATVQNAYGWGSRWNSATASNGIHTITATVTDNNGKTQTTSITVTVKN